MRAFIAIELPLATKEFLNQLQKELEKTIADVKWVEFGNIHLTLKFLGDIDGDILDKVKNIMAQVATSYNTFKCGISSIGAFPKIEHPRVIWVGLDRQEELIKLASSLEEEITKLGIPKEERPFSTHITIGRVRSPKNIQKLVQKLLNEKLDSHLNHESPKELDIRKITLFKSTLTSKGPIYEIIYEAALNTT